MPTATVVNFAARGILSVSASLGIDVATLIQGAGIEERLLAEPGARVPLDNVIRLWEGARRSARDDTFGLHVAEFLPFGAYKTYDLLLATAPTVGEALVKAAKYNGFVNDAFRPCLRQKRGGACIEYFNIVDPKCNPPEYLEFIFACFMLRFRLTTGVDLRPAEIHFQHSPPRDLSEHYRLFQAPILFRQPMTRVFLDSSVLRIPQLSADAPTSELLEHYIQATLKRPSVSDDLTVALRRALNGLMISERVTLAAAARDLGVSRRGLQRKLAARGTSFREMFRALRSELALTLLSRRDISMSETADSLGFSELSSFNRAFKKWTGLSPQAYRRKPAG
ncbi:MAG: AraC family transcriptional regulator [Acidobacteria bacterium]|nr:AraC family transcriptional regulator [Acidobacteriota bacterium]